MAVTIAESIAEAQRSLSFLSVHLSTRPVPAGVNYFLLSSDCCLNRSENNLNPPESFLHEREDILERWEHFHGLLEVNLKVCDNLLHLPNKYLKD
jgi:hypothetical protein